MNFLDVLSSANQTAIESRVYGVVIGIVTNNQDPDQLGRVKVTFPWLNDRDEGYWARLATPMAGAERGFYFLPEVEDEVLVVFEQGDVRFPYILGALWNNQDQPPANNDDGKNNIRLIKSRSGHLIRLDDTDGKEKIEILDKSGKNSLIFDTQNNSVTIRAAGDITLSAPQGTLTLEAQQLEFKANDRSRVEAKQIQLEAQQSIELNASNTAKVTAGTQLDVEARGIVNVKGQLINLN